MSKKLLCVFHCHLFIYIIRATGYSVFKLTLHTILSLSTATFYYTKYMKIITNNAVIPAPAMEICVLCYALMDGNDKHFGIEANVCGQAAVAATYTNEK